MSNLVNPYRFGGAAGPGTDPDFASVELLLHGDGADASTTFTDSSDNNLTPLEKHGDPEIDTAQYKWGGSSMWFDGNDMLRYRPTDIPSIGTQTFTLEGWVRFSSLPGGLATLFGIWTDTSDKEFVFGYHGGTGGLRFFYSTNGSSTTGSPTFSWSPSTNTWYHVAICRDGSDDVRAFVDGTQVGSTQNITANIADQGGHPCVAGTFETPLTTKNHLTGWVDDLRVTIGAARYTGAFTPPTEAFPNS